MKKFDTKDNYFNLIITGLFVTFAIILITLISFTWEKIDLSMNSSIIPVYDIERIDIISDILKERQDINIQGKPNTDKFNFGNTEPF